MRTHVCATDLLKLIGKNVTLTQYQAEQEQQVRKQQKTSSFASAPTSTTILSYARLGLLGNPSDGFHGKTISLSLANFWAEVHP